MQFILKFTIDQMMKYISYFVCECVDQNQKTLLDFRITQMFHFMRASDFSPADFIILTKMVQEKHDQSMDSKLWKDLLTMLYLYEPKAQNVDHDDISTTNSTICSTDKIIYRVILDLAEIGEGTYTIFESLTEQLSFFGVNDNSICEIVLLDRLLCSFSMIFLQFFLISRV